MSQQVTVSNSGNPDSLLHGRFPVAPGDSAPLVGELTPGAPGSLAATLTMTTDRLAPLGEAGETLVLSLEGVGTEPRLIVLDRFASGDLSRWSAATP